MDKQELFEQIEELLDEYLLAAEPLEQIPEEEMEEEEPVEDEAQEESDDEILKIVRN